MYTEGYLYIPWTYILLDADPFQLVSHAVSGPRHSSVLCWRVYHTEDVPEIKKNPRGQSTVG